MDCTHAAARDLDIVVPVFEQAKLIIGLGLHEAMARLFLHAASLAYTDPESGKLMLFKAPMDNELEEVLSVLRQ